MLPLSEDDDAEELAATRGTGSSPGPLTGGQAPAQVSQSSAEQMPQSQSPSMLDPLSVSGIAEDMPAQDDQSVCR